jgi:hypothetical protein
MKQLVMNQFLPFQKQNNMGYKSTDYCIQKAGEDEMLFVLRAQDITSPAIVLEWMKINFGNLSEDKLREAFECALEMRKFKNKKLPD